MPTHTRPQAILFDVYNTLISVETGDDDPAVWRLWARAMSYHGPSISAETLYAGYRAHMLQQQRERNEEYPEIDLPEIFTRVLRDSGYREPERLGVWAYTLFRALSIRTLELFPDTLDALRALQGRFRLALVTDAQPSVIGPELAQFDLAPFFEAIVISAEYPYRKPDPRLFQTALERLKVAPADAIYVGDNAYRDICGAQRAGMRAVLLQRPRRVTEAEPGCHPDHAFPTLTAMVEWLETLPHPSPRHEPRGTEAGFPSPEGRERG